MFEVRTTIPESVQDAYQVETKRVNRKDAEQDADMLKLFGKTAWIVEVA